MITSDLGVTNFVRYLVWLGLGHVKSGETKSGAGKIVISGATKPVLLAKFSSKILTRKNWSLKEL